VHSQIFLMRSTTSMVEFLRADAILVDDAERFLRETVVVPGQR
jgi:hypothetical protein